MLWSLLPLFSPGSRVVNHFSSRITFHSPLSSFPKNIHKHIQHLNQAFCQSQNSPYNAAVVANGRVKKSNVVCAIAHIWYDNHIAKQLKCQTMNVMPAKAELMAIYIYLIPVMEDNNMHNIIVVTDSITTTSKVLESNVNPFQKIIILLATKIKSFLSRDNRNAIHFWHCPSKAKWPRHRLVNNQVKATDNTPTLPSKNSFLFSKKKKVKKVNSVTTRLQLSTEVKIYGGCR